MQVKYLLTIPIALVLLSSTTLHCSMRKREQERISQEKQKVIEESRYFQVAKDIADTARQGSKTFGHPVKYEDIMLYIAHRDGYSQKIKDQVDPIITKLGFNIDEINKTVNEVKEQIKKATNFTEELKKIDTEKKKPARPVVSAAENAKLIEFEKYAKETEKKIKDPKNRIMLELFLTGCKNKIDDLQEEIDDPENSEERIARFTKYLNMLKNLEKAIGIEIGKPKPEPAPGPQKPIDKQVLMISQFSNDELVEKTVQSSMALVTFEAETTEIKEDPIQKRKAEALTAYIEKLFAEIKTRKLENAFKEKGLEYGLLKEEVAVQPSKISQPSKQPAKQPSAQPGKALTLEEELRQAVEARRKRMKA